MTSTRTVLVLTSDPDGPVVRHRFGLFASALETVGIALEIGAWPKAGRVRQQTLARAGDVDAVVVSSRLLKSSDVRALRARTGRLRFDFDDALVFRDSSRGATRSGTRTRRFGAIVAAADRVTAGNRYLAQLARDAGREALVLPTVVDVPDEAPPEPGIELPIFGWIGSFATMQYLEGAGSALGSLAARGQGFRVRVIADVAPHWSESIDTEFVRWTPETWQAALAGVHVGLAPLPDDAWTRGKCGLKLLQCCASGRPVVASPVGVQAEQVLDGETGLLAADRPAFETALQTLLDEPERRRAMGARAFARVKDAWSVEAWVAANVAEMEALLSGERSAEAE